MSISTLTDTDICPICWKDGGVSVEFPFCRHCAWEIFDSCSIVDSPNALLDDLPNRQANRLRFFIQLDKKAAEATLLQGKVEAQTQANEETQRQIVELRSKIATREKEIAELKKQCEKMDGSYHLIAAKELATLSPQEREFIQNAKMVDYFHFQAKVEIVPPEPGKPAQHRAEKFAFLRIWLDQALPQNYDLAVGFSRKPMLKIADAEVVYRSRLRRKDFTRNALGQWEKTETLPVGVLSEGEWHIKIAPMEQRRKNYIGGQLVRVTTPESTDDKPGSSPRPHTIIV